MEAKISIYGANVKCFCLLKLYKNMNILLTVIRKSCKNVDVFFFSQIEISLIFKLLTTSYLGRNDNENGNCYFS
jgi:hypothetical protein